MTEAAIRHRIRADGPWQTMLPGIYLASRGAPTTTQRATGAYLYAGKPIAITGPAALAWYSLPTVRSEAIDVLVPLGCSRKDARFVRLHRTGVVPNCGREGIVRYAAPAGQLLAITDAWWPQAGVAVEVDSREWHLSPADWERTLARDSRMTAHGILVLRFTPKRIRTCGRDVASQIRSVLATSAARPLPQIEARAA